MKELVKLLQRTFPENIVIRSNFESGEFFIDADPTRMQQAIMNLVFNARDAMSESGELLITLSRSELRKPMKCVTCGEVMEGNWIQIFIHDNGDGIPAAIINHIFEPFFTTKAPGQGTGLGLAQVYGIIKQHSGHITVSMVVKPWKFCNKAQRRLTGA
ncbi:MAG: ATP-binding protein [Chloroflexota bacterium]